MANLIPKIVYGSISPTEISLDYPAVEDDPEQLISQGKESESISGVQQVANFYIEAVKKVKLSFLSEALLSSLRTFFTGHALHGKPFKWYPDKDESDFEWYVLSKRNFQPRRIAPVGAAAFIYELGLELRRVFDLTGEYDMTIPILNNQATPLSLSGLLINSSTDTSMIVFYELRRKTDSEERVCSGSLHLIYRESTSTWDIADKRDGDELGVTFSITSPAGQVQYISDSMSGSNYEGEFIFKQVDLND